jgi:aminoglycoside phosphotransferase (APT) family kinase protein
MQDIKGYNSFTKIESVNKGWSSDKKYYIETSDGRRLLLRVAGISEYPQKKSEFQMMKQVAALEVDMPMPVEFGTCDNGGSVYLLLTWCDGEDAESILPNLTETDQYMLGVRAGEMLKLIHSIPAPMGQEENNRNMFSGRPQCFQHGDYHVGNMIVSQDKTLSIIDFNRFDFGDPWEEFNRIVWSATFSPHFATGQINGYFGGEPPIEFFKLLAFYISSNTLSSISWAIPFGEKEIITMKNQARDVLSWFDNMNNLIPTWYLENLYIK